MRDKPSRVARLAFYAGDFIFITARLSALEILIKHNYHYLCFVKVSENLNSMCARFHSPSFRSLETFEALITYTCISAN